MSDLLEARALVQTPACDTPQASARAVQEALVSLFEDPARAREMGVRAQAAVRRRQGATRGVAQALVSALDRPPEPPPKRPKKRFVLPALLALYAVAAFWATPSLRHAWSYLRMNPQRRYTTFLGLSAATAAMPWCLGDARRAYAALARPPHVPGPDEDGIMRYGVTPALARLLPSLFPGCASAFYDARLKTMADMREFQEAFRARHGGYRLWCIGKWDYLFIAPPPGGAVRADGLFAEFSARFEEFAAAGIYAPAQLFACYVGADAEVAPAFAQAAQGSRFPAWDAFWGRLLPARLAFKPTPRGAGAPVRASRLTPEEEPSMLWLKRGGGDAGVFLDFLDTVSAMQNARRNILVGMDLADAGGLLATNAVSLWTAAAQVHARDPLLTNLADTLDHQGRRLLDLGNPQGAMQCYENRILICPHDVAAIHNFGVCLQRSGHFEMASKVFMKAARMTRDNVPHLLAFADSAAAAGRHEDALKTLETLLKRSPGNAEIKRRISKTKAALYRKNIKERYK